MHQIQVDAFKWSHASRVSVSLRHCASNMKPLFFLDVGNSNEEHILDLGDSGQERLSARTSLSQHSIPWLSILPMDATVKEKVYSSILNINSRRVWNRLKLGIPGIPDTDQALWGSLASNARSRISLVLFDLILFWYTLLFLQSVARKLLASYTGRLSFDTCAVPQSAQS